MLNKTIFIKLHGNAKTKSRRLCSGMSIIELMIGLAIGLFILAGASAMFVNNVVNSRQILLESRINQDLRSTMDLITRDLRRGGYWGNSLAGTVATGSNSTTVANPYTTVTRTGTNAIGYAYTRGTENDALDTATEQFGFKLDTSIKAIQMNIGGSTWQTLTNTDIVNIPNNGFTITPTETAIDVRAACAKTCIDTVLPPSIPTSAENCPRIQVRTYNIVLTGESTANPAVTRTLRSQVRVRNDAISGACPA
jgi:type IV pilus assembly protein PilW